MKLDVVKNRWRNHGFVGFFCCGAGVAVVFDAAYRRLTEAQWELWAAEGGLGLVLLLVGLAFFGSAVRYLVHMDRIAEYEDRKARHQSREQRSRAKTRTMTPQSRQESMALISANG